MNQGIIIHSEDFNDLLSMSAEEAGFIVKNMIKTLKGEEVVSFDDRYLTRVSNEVCRRVLYDAGVSNRQSGNGSKGGAPKGNQNAKKQPKNNPKTTQKQPKTSLNTYTYTNTYTNNKKQYGECANVFLTDEEHDKIISEGLAGLIDELSLYIASKGDKYKSHYAVIKQWANRRKKEADEKKVIRPNQFTEGVAKREIDFSALEKRLTKN